MAAKQSGPLVEAQDRPEVLGFARAVTVVCAAAGTDARYLGRTLSEIGVDGVSFQGMVFNGMRAEGYTMDVDAIPDGPDTTLIEVVEVIQSARAV